MWKRWLNPNLLLLKPVFVYIILSLTECRWLFSFHVESQCPLHIWGDGTEDGKPEFLVPSLESIYVRLYYKMENLHLSSHKEEKITSHCQNCLPLRCNVINASGFPSAVLTSRCPLTQLFILIFHDNTWALPSTVFLFMPNSFQAFRLLVQNCYKSAKIRYKQYNDYTHTVYNVYTKSIMTYAHWAPAS